MILVRLAGYICSCSFLPYTIRPVLASTSSIASQCSSGGVTPLSSSAADAGVRTRLAIRTSRKKREKKRRVFISNSCDLCYNRMYREAYPFQSGGKKRRDSTVQLLVYQKTGGSSTVSRWGKPTKSEIIL